MSDYSYVFNAHPSFIEDMYVKYQQDPSSVEEGWRLFFKGFDFNDSSISANGHGIQAPVGGGVGIETIDKEFAVLSIIHGYRDRGHLLSDTNPIRQRKDRKPFLSISDYGLEEADMDKPFHAGEEIGLHQATLGQILAKLQKIYTGKIGFEYAHIEDRAKRMWLRNKIEGISDVENFGLTIEQKKRILEKLNGAAMFEKFLHTKYVGQKRFSLEGGETTIAALDAIISTAGVQGVEEVIIGMAHRGRLNVLANIMGKTYEEIFSEFEGTAVPDLAFGDGDVKYHMGFSSQVKTLTGGDMRLKLIPNPSHLEAVDPVVEGYARAMGDIEYGKDFTKVLPILIHGDAAIAGQGVAYEVVQMSKLKGYYTGGTVHFVINNQIGFTTDFDDARSSTYCTAAAKMVQAPVFHVNGDDPEAVVFASQLAMEYLQQFGDDVFIDMVCYRKHGHNEGDDPRFTQPGMYNYIKTHPNPREIYLKELLQRNVVEKEMAEELETAYWNDLQARLDLVKENPLPYNEQEPDRQWKKLKRTADPEDFKVSPVTGVPEDLLKDLLNKLITFPDGFKPIPKVNRLLKNMQALIAGNSVDWGLAELLAYATLLTEGHNIRMSGQDVKRGTFSHRHAVVYDAETFEDYNRLSRLSSDQGEFMIYNSLLSEFAVLGFEYGYSLASPDSLVIWEAQFGDFCNGAQTIIDQFISAAESKWQKMSGLVMLLPHGYEGQGPEHSSARLERFLQLSAEFNMTIANCTTPANFFHLLRRQLYRPFRKPLIHMSPKSLLRHPLCVSDLSELTDGSRFKEILDDPQVEDAKKVSRVLFCTGKIYYDLLERKQKDNRDDVAIVRMEQIYPLPLDQIEEIQKKYEKADYYWVQEEPSNMGAWQYFWSFYRSRKIELIGRKSSASPASGFKKVHDNQQLEIIDKAFS